MADGPPFAANAIKAGMTLEKTLQIAPDFRQRHRITHPYGAFNPIYIYGRAFWPNKEAGVDGLIIVDLPPEEDGELCDPQERLV